MTLYEKLKDAGQIDVNGLVCLAGDQAVGSDNGVLFSAYYKNICNKIGETPEGAVTIAVGRCLAYGNPIRKPGDYSLNSPDNLIGIMSFYPNDVYNYGRETFPRFNYNTPDPKKFTFDSWLGRQIGLVGYMQLMSNRILSPIRYLALVVGLWLTSREPLGSTSDRLLAQLMIDMMPNRFYTKPLKRWWNNKIKKQYIGGINSVVVIYFGPNHVFSRTWY